MILFTGFGIGLIHLSVVNGSCKQAYSSLLNVSNIRRTDFTVRIAINADPSKRSTLSPFLNIGNCVTAFSATKHCTDNVGILSFIPLERVILPTSFLLWIT